MHSIVPDNVEAIRARAGDHGVLQLEVFGSVCTDEFNPERSDVDLLIECSENIEFGPRVRRCFDFKEDWESLLERPADLVEIDAPQNT